MHLLPKANGSHFRLFDCSLAVELCQGSPSTAQTESIPSHKEKWNETIQLASLLVKRNVSL
jgi:hypothetical protein